jgi:hypothetical protein
VIILITGLVVNYTTAFFNTLATTAPTTATAADNLLTTQGAFDYTRWVSTGQSGLIVTNVSTSKVWVYFTVAGSLSGAIGPLNPVELAPQQSYDIPLALVDVGDLGLLQWKNQNSTFSGAITAGLLNNYASCTVGTVNLTGAELYASLVKDKDDPTGQLDSIKTVGDIAGLLNNVASLTAEVQSLGQQVDQLTSENNTLNAQGTSLQSGGTGGSTAGSGSGTGGSVSSSTGSTGTTGTSGTSSTGSTGGSTTGSGSGTASGGSFRSGSTGRRTGGSRSFGAGSTGSGAGAH